MFSRTLSQMLMMFSLILVGFLLRKKQIIPNNGGSVMAKMENFIFVPALSLYTMITKCSVKSLTDNASLILYGLALIAGAVCVAYLLAGLFVPYRNKDASSNYLRNVYKYALTFGNFGFMGNFIALSVWGTDFLYQYSLFTFFISLLCSTWGLIILIPKDSSAGVLTNMKKGLLAPPVLAIFIGIILGLTDAQKVIPDFVMNALDSAGKCQGPVAMVLTGFVIGGFDMRKLLSDKKVYVASFLRLIALPGVMLLILRIINAPESIVLLMLIAFATPLGMNTVVYPAAYDGDTRPGAAMAVVSNVIGVATLPLMYMLFTNIL